MTRAEMAKTRADMAKAHIGDIPRQNPCAQCGTPIPSPDWIEPGEGRDKMRAQFPSSAFASPKPMPSIGVPFKRRRSQAAAA